MKKNTTTTTTMFSDHKIKQFFMEACLRGDMTVIPHLLNAYPELVNYQEPLHEFTGMKYAMLANKPAVVEYLREFSKNRK